MRTQSTAASIAFLIAQVCSVTASAQSEFKGAAIVPNNPSATDSIVYVRYEPGRFCSRTEQQHKVTMQNNNINITFSSWAIPLLVGAQPPDTGTRTVDMVDLGRLPAGDYTLTTVGAPCKVSGAGEASPPDIDKVPFKVTESKRVYPYRYGFPPLDFSGHWWDENDSGWGLFIWQDNVGNTMAAWFSYTADGKPAWYVFQPIAGLAIVGPRTDVWQTSKPPGDFAPPPGVTKLTKAGEAGLDFYYGYYNRGAGAGLATVEQFAKFTYRLGDDAQQTRTLMRFKAK